MTLLEKEAGSDGGFVEPTSATSGINAYDQEGARRKPKVKKDIPDVKDSPAVRVAGRTASDDVPDFDADTKGSGTRAHSVAAGSTEKSKSKKKKSGSNTDKVDKSNPNHDSQGLFSDSPGMSASTQQKVAAAVAIGRASFSNPDLSAADKALVHDWKTGNSNVLSTSEFKALVTRGVVTQDVTVYRAGSTSDSKVLEYSLRPDWVKNTAEASDRQVVALHLKVGDHALFVPYATEHHLVEVGVLVPPSMGTVMKASNLHHDAQRLVTPINDTDEFDDTNDTDDNDSDGNHNAGPSGNDDDGPSPNRDMNEARKVNNDPKDPNAADAFDTDPNASGYGKGKKVDKAFAITQLDEPALEKFFARHEKFFKSEKLVKGVYDVACLSSLIAQLNTIALGADVERQIEGDDSKVPEDLRNAAAGLLGVLSDMASEEAKEIRDGSTAEDVMRDTQPSMTAGLYRADVGEFAKALRSSLFGEDNKVEKLGARNSAKDMETIQKVHDASCELGANCGSPHDKDGNTVDPDAALKFDEGDQNTGDDDMQKVDTISAEGNKRGAAVSSPNAKKPGPESDNADNDDNTADAGQQKSTASTSTKRKARMDANGGGNSHILEAEKGKSRDEDDDEDEDEDDDAPPAKDSAKKGKSRKDEDEDEDFPPKKAKKSFTMDEDSLAKVVATAVATAMAMVKGEGTVRDVRLPPNLMQVGKEGEVAKLQNVNLDELRKTVTPIDMAPPKEPWRAMVDPITGQPTNKMVGDNDTATLIKAIRANPAFRLKASDIPGGISG